MTDHNPHHAADTDPLPLPGTGAMLAINSPLSTETVHRLAGVATAHEPTTIVDHGCGWGTMLLACLEQAPGARGAAADRRRARAHVAGGGGH